MSFLFSLLVLLATAVGSDDDAAAYLSPLKIVLLRLPLLVLLLLATAAGSDDDVAAFYHH